MIPGLVSIQPLQKEFPTLPFLKILETDVSYRRVYAYLDMPQNASIVWFPMNLPESVRRMVDNTQILRNIKNVINLNI